MPSSNFDYTRHIKAITRTLHNEALENFFKNIKNSKGETIKVDDDSVSTKLSSLKTACKIDSKDSLLIMQSKQTLFDLLQKTFESSASASELVYGMPVATFKQNIKYVPQISLELLESYESAKENGRSQLKMSCTFRLMDKTATEINDLDLEVWANRIKNNFTTGKNPKKYRKGEIKYNYRDEMKGYRLSVAVQDETDGREIITDILNIQNHSFDDSCVSMGKSEKRSGSRPNDVLVLGEYRKLPQFRPKCDVFFNRAWIDIWELNKPIMLCQFKRGRLITFGD